MGVINESADRLKKNVDAINAGQAHNPTNMTAEELSRRYGEASSNIKKKSPI